MTLEEIADDVSMCTGCSLYRCRINTVPGEGSSMPDLMFIGEAPGATEDQEGRPFIGKAGLILTEMVSSLGLERGQVFITNVIKCRPPNNRLPRPDEIEACLPYLERQIKILRPKIVVLMGNVAMFSILGMRGMGSRHGKTYERNGIKFFVTCHPAASFRSGGWRRAMIEDFEILGRMMRKLGEKDGLA